MIVRGDVDEYSSSAASVSTMVFPIVEPRALAFVIWSAPFLIVVTPSYVFKPDSVSVPVPSFVRPPEPAMIPS